MHVELKIASLLLSYPFEELRNELPNLKQALAGRDTVPSRIKQPMYALIDHLASRDLMEAQEEYVLLFDRSRALSLHLFEHVHGESRDRGQAMVDLAIMYENNGFVIDAKELPDHLPLFLEFLSTQSFETVHDLLGQVSHILKAIEEKLVKRDTPYAGLFSALVLMSNSKPDAKLLSELRKVDDVDPNDLVALDRVWEEEIVTFGGNAGENSCGPDRLRTQIRAEARKPSDVMNVLPV